MKRTPILSALGVSLILTLGNKAQADTYSGPLIETLSLQHSVEPEGDLPPIEERIPSEPLVVDLEARDRVPGKHGGTLRMFVSRSKDVRYMAVWGYARLVGYNDKEIDLNEQCSKRCEVVQADTVTVTWVTPYPSTLSSRSATDVTSPPANA